MKLPRTPQCTEEPGNGRNSSCETYVSSSVSDSSKCILDINGSLSLGGDYDIKKGGAALTLISNVSLKNAAAPLTPPLVPHEHSKLLGFKAFAKHHD